MNTTTAHRKPDSVLTLQQCATWMERYQQRIHKEHAYLTDLDAKIGDADHGSNMLRGVNAITDRLQKNPVQSIGKLMESVGMLLLSSVGGASGPLYGTFFLRAGQESLEKECLTAEEFVYLLQIGTEGMRRRGRTSLGDKTMFDVFSAVCESAQQALPCEMNTLVARMAEAAREAVEESKPWIAKRGRARYLGEKSAGHIDPGSASAQMLFETLAEVFTTEQ